MNQASLFGKEVLDEENNKRFEQVAAEQGLRTAEMVVQKPEPLEKIIFQGKEIMTLKILFYFQSIEDINLVKKYFRINEYKELNINNTDLLWSLLKGIEQGKIKIEDLPCKPKNSGKLF